MDPPRPPQMICGAPADDCVPSAHDVRVDDVSKGVLGDGVPRFRDADAGVGDDHIQPAQFINRSVDRPAKLVEMPSVGGRGNHAAAEGDDLTFRFRKVIPCRGVVWNMLGEWPGEIHGDDVRALAGQSDRVYAPLPPGRTGYQRRPSL